MRIAIDATPLLLRSAGVKNYFYHWIRHLRRLGPRNSFRLFPFLGDYGALDHERSVLPPLATWPRLGLLYFVNIPHNPAISALTASADVFHVTNQVRVAPRRTPLTATVHDMTCWLLPQLHTPANVRADRSFADRVLRRATGLIAVSESTRRDTARLLSIDEDRIEVIYPGVSEAFINVPAEDVFAVREHYGLDRPYVLFLGTIEPRKNVDTLLDAWDQLPESVRAEHELLIAGPVGWSAAKTLARLDSGLPGVRYLGYVAEQDLPALTAGAVVFVYPSLYEGFGFPVAQAMAAGVPVIVSNVSSLPEVAGDAGVLIDPHSPAELRAAIERLLDDSSRREELSARAKLHSQSFRWETCARRSLLFFEDVVGRL
ncbi:MAG: glycosyltransferase family 4 protein [bacterium]|nr:glycosyltransferase family 4 protein [bacterium]